MNFFKKVWFIVTVIWKWLVYSSTNADKISLTIKSTFLALIPAIMIVAGLYNIKLDNSILTSFIDEVSAIIIVVGGAITVISGCFGALRKIYTTAVGSNAVINSYRE